MIRFLTILYVFLCANVLAQEIQIECSVFQQAKRDYNGYIINESYHRFIFAINDVSKLLFINSNGANVPINGIYKTFNKDEIDIRNSDIFKDKVTDFKINRRSGSITINNFIENRWLGDVTSVGMGQCSKLQGAKF